MKIDQQSGSLLLLQSSTLGGLQSLRDTIELLKTTFSDIVFSSVYKEKDSRRRSSYDGKLICVAKVESQISLSEFIAIVDAMVELPNFPSVQLTVLSHRDEIEMLPNRAIPHPYLHSHAAIAFCVLEVSPSYFHPVFKKSLTELVRTLIPRSSAEFVSLGR